MNQSISENTALSVVTKELSFSDIFKLLWIKKWWIIIVTLSGILSSIAYSLSIPNLYKAEALLVPTETKQGLDSQFGGIAALAGVNIGSQGDNKSKLALEIMQSRTFLAPFIKKHNIEPALMAAKSWDSSSRTLIIDDQIYNQSKEEWYRTPTSPLRAAEPSEQELVDAFKGILDVVTEPSSNMSKVSVEFISPVEASLWVNLLINEINEHMRKRDIDKAEKSIKYLQTQMNNNSLASVRSSLSVAIEEQIKTLTIANVEEQYVFTTLDSAIPPEVKSKPRRALIVLMCTFLSALISIFTVLFFCLKK